MKQFLRNYWPVAIGLLFSVNSVFASTYLYPTQGGLGTSTAPTFGQIPLGNASGTYTLTATSSLGLGGQGVIITGGILTAIISSNSTTTIVGTATTGAGPLRVVSQGKYAYVGNQTAATFQIFETSTNTPSLIKNLAPSGASSVTGLAVQGNYAYAIDNTANKFYVINIADPKNAYVVKTVSDPDPSATDMWNAFISGRYLFVTVYNPDGRVLIYDIANPNNPIFISALNNVSGSKIEDVFVAENYAYAVDSVNNKMFIWDISNISKPVLAATYSSGFLQSLQTVYVSGNFAYLGGAVGLEVVDISNKTSPVYIGGFGSGSIFDLKLSGRYLFASHQVTNKISIFDTATTSQPTLIFDILGVSGPKGISLNGRYLYAVGNTNNKLVKIDLTGIETTSANIHSLMAGNISTTEDINTRSVFARGVLSSGIQGLSTLGSLSVSSTNTPSIILGGLYVGTTSPATTSPNLSSFQQSVVVVEATSTGSVPLTLRGVTSQLANLFQVQNSANSNLFFIDKNGGFLTTASSTINSNFNVAGPLSASSTLNVGGLSYLTGFLSSASSTVNGTLNLTGILTSLTSATSSFAGGIQINGTGNVCLPSGICIGASGGTLSGSGANGQLGLWNGATSLTGSSTLVYNTNFGYLGIGTSTPYAQLSVKPVLSVNPIVAVASSTNQDVFDIWASGTTTIDQLQTGTLTFSPDSGLSTLIDLPIINAANNTQEGYNLSLDASSTLTVWGLADGNGSIKQQRIGIASSTPTTELSIQITGGATSTITNGGSNQPGGIQLWSKNGTPVCIFADNSGVVSSYQGYCE